MKALDPAYRCECGLVGERCDDPKFTAPDGEWRDFYAAHPLRRGLGQSVRSRTAEAHLRREQRAGRAR